MPRLRLRPRLEVSGSNETLERNVQRQLDAIGQHTDSLIDGLYTPATPSDWTAPAPTTLKDAIDRIVAVVAAGLSPP